MNTLESNISKILNTGTGEIVMYQPDNSIRLEVRLEEETVWLSLNQMATLFNRDKSVISRHISNIFKEEELLMDSTVANFATVQIEGDRVIEREIEHFNLDVSDINEDTRMQLELINEMLAKLQSDNNQMNKPRKPIGFRTLSNKE